MNYRALNDIQRKRMLQISKNDFSMEWGNPDFFDILIGKLPTIHHYQTESEIQKELNELYKCYSKLLVFSCPLECRTNMLISQGE